MYTTGLPTDQRSGVRPVSFVLDNGGSFSSQIILALRPEDLTRTEPSRITPHQTLGRGMIGWADQFGPGLPSVSIAGHTGWRPGGGSGEDGIAAFLALNHLVHHGFHEAVQQAIDTGRDPAMVKLIFADLLDEFCWSVVPTSFVLRRSRSRPLLMQYTIQLQALSINLDDPSTLFPDLGSFSTGIEALDAVLNTLDETSLQIQSWVSQALAYKDQVLAPVANTVKQFVAVTQRVYRATSAAMASIRGGISNVTNSLVGIAGDLSTAGTTIFGTLSAVDGLPGYLRSSLITVAGAYNEAFCIFPNTLRIRRIYDDFSSLYGASNCSSTTGGRMASAYAGRNVNTFAAIQPEPAGFLMSSAALSSVATLKRFDPVFSSIDLPELARHLANINNGLQLL